MEHLHQFWAVTTDPAIYKAEEIMDQGRCVGVSLRVIQGQPKKGHKPSEELAGGDTMLGICASLVPYLPSSRERGIESVNTRYWVERSITSWVAALFDNEAEAQKCSQAANLERCDPRWLESTKSVIGRIDSNNGRFYVPSTPDQLNLLYGKAA